jgi:GTP-binding protein
MKFVDVAKIKIVSGNGGAGAVSFRREKFVPMGGPDGGRGGDGGDVYFRAKASLQTLMDLHFKRIYKAQNGSPGARRNRSGTRGHDITIDVPCGTQIYDEDDGLIADLCKDGEVILAAPGGRGGAGNDAFATSVNRAPRYAQPGLPGEEKFIRLELKLLADVGLLGLPNAGKSTLLKALTNASPKIGSYPFTTLYPNLGVLKFIDREIVVADIPGLVEGASEGIGLGHDFLRHVSRTKALIHLVSGETEDAEICIRDFDVIIDELKKSFPEMLDRPTIVVLSKTDIMDADFIEDICDHFKARGIEVLPISAIDGNNMDILIQKLVELVK